MPKTRTNASGDWVDVSTERPLENDLKDIKSRVLAMAGFVEESIERAIVALITRSRGKLAAVFDFEKEINNAHVAIDNACLGVLARRSPVAADLRLVIAIIKINTDLERMGDQAVNVAKSTNYYLSRPEVDLAQSLPEMASLVRSMVRKSLDAFVNASVSEAEAVLASDDEVDAFKNRMVAELTERMRLAPTEIEGCLNLVLITRNLERIADHATNIAEDVIFASTGKDVRHGSGRKEEKNELHDESRRIRSRLGRGLRPRHRDAQTRSGSRSGGGRRN